MLIKCDVIINSMSKITHYVSSGTHKKYSLFHFMKLYIHVVLFSKISSNLERGSFKAFTINRVFNGKIMLMFCKSYSLFFIYILSYTRLLIDVKLAENFVVYN